MNKYLKISLAIMILSIICSVGISKAYTSPDYHNFMGIKLPASKKAYKSSTYTKNTTTVQQYHHTGDITSWSGDCDDCMVRTDLSRVGTGITAEVNTYAGDLISFNVLSAEKGDYFMELWRQGFTLVSTEHYGVWYINTLKP